MMDHRGPDEVKRTVPSEAVPKKERRSDPIFVHSKLDEYGLSLIEFRLCARVARRGSCYESLPSLANDFRVSEQTIRRAYRVLVRCKLLTETRQPGFSSTFTLNPFSNWAHPSLLEEIRSSVLGKPRKQRHPPGKKKTVAPTPTPRVTPDTGDRGNTGEGSGLTPDTGAPLTLGNDEGTPPEGTPRKVLPYTHTVECSEGADGVCADLPISRQRYKAYAGAQRGIDNPVAWATKAERLAGKPQGWDADVREWEEEQAHELARQKQIQAAAAEQEAMRNAEFEAEFPGKLEAWRRENEDAKRKAG